MPSKKSIFAGDKQNEKGSFSLFHKLNFKR